MLTAYASGATTHSNAVVGLIVICVFVAVIVGLTVALVRAHIRLARANAELSFLRGPFPTPPAPPAPGPQGAWRG
jgi:hypothetical protein